jgi:hypothetical protein
MQVPSWAPRELDPVRNATFAVLVGHPLAYIEVFEMGGSLPSYKAEALRYRLP